METNYVEYIQDIAFNDTCDKMAISTTSQKIIIYQKVLKKSNDLIVIDNEIKEELNQEINNKSPKNIFHNTINFRPKADKKIRKSRDNSNKNHQIKLEPLLNDNLNTKSRKTSSRSLISIESSNSKNQSRSIIKKDTENEIMDEGDDEDKNDNSFSRSKNSSLFKSLNFESKSKNNFKLDRINSANNDEINDDSFNSLYNFSSISKNKKNKEYEYRWEKIISWTTDGPALRLEWANSEFGNIVACSGYNKCVYIFKEEKTSNWKCSTKIIEFTDIVEDISFVPKNDSLELATITADGTLRTFYPFPGRNNWQSNHILSFPKSRCTCLCCNPSNLDNLTIVVGFKKRQFIEEVKNDKNNINNEESKIKELKKQDSTKNISNDLIRLVYFKNNNNALIGAINEIELEDDITDVDWANQNGRLYHMICSTSKDGKLIIFEINLLDDEMNNTAESTIKNNSFFSYKKIHEYKHTKPLWRCSFNNSGILCSCIDEDGEVIVFMKIGRDEFIKLDINKKK